MAASPPPTGLTPIGGRYQLGAPIATGANATVYLGRQLGTAGFWRTVAIKRLAPSYARDPAFRARFVDDARLAARIRHPNVVPIIDCVAESGELLIVMDLVAGEALVRLLRAVTLRGERVPPRIASAIVSDALHGLHAAHEVKDERGRPLGIVHGAVSPSNVLVGVDGVSRVIDFGTAAKAAGRQDDVLAAAAVLSEALTGERLRGGASTVPLPSNRAPGITAQLDAVVMRGLERDATGRFATAREMAEALEAACPRATAAEVGAWVEANAGPALERLAKGISAIESGSSDAPTLAPSTEPAPSIPYVATDLAPRGPASPIEPGDPGQPPPATAALQGGPPSRNVLFAVIGGATMGVLAAAVLVVRFRAVAAPSAAPLPPLPVAAVDVVAAAPEASTCPEGMVPVPGGKFFMGSDEKDAIPFEKPAHKVTVTPFCIDRHEVTVEQYVGCSARGACKLAATVNADWDSEILPAQHAAYDALCNGRDPVPRKSHPINCVDWEMADVFCRADGARLPTEAEWEFAARGPDGRKYPWGDDEPTGEHLNACGLECVAWGKEQGVPKDLPVPMYPTNDGFQTTAPVGSFPRGRSRYGVEDVVGNVWEWVADWYAPYVPEAGEGAVDPKGPATGTRRVIRGGAWNGTQAAWVRPTFRYFARPTMHSHGVGFRCAKSI